MDSKVVSLADYRVQKEGSEATPTVEGTPLSKEHEEALRALITPCNGADFDWSQWKNAPAPTYDEALGASAASMTELGAEFYSVYKRVTGDDQFLFTGNVPSRRDEREVDRFPFHPLGDFML